MFRFFHSLTLSLLSTSFCNSASVLSASKTPISARSIALLSCHSLCAAYRKTFMSTSVAKMPLSSSDSLRKLSQMLPLQSSFTAALPGATFSNPRQPTPRVPRAIYAFVEPTPLEVKGGSKDSDQKSSSTAEPTVSDPLRLVALSEDLCRNTLELDPSEVRTEQFVRYFSGNEVIPAESRPWAHRYGGHQFGYWANQLGDGRAISLGEVVNSRNERWELQLKGAGLTPFSRFADGRAVLRSSIREFLASEHMYALGVPTSRALSLIHAPHHHVQREIVETAAVVCRVAPSWLRLGSFQILAALGETEELRTLANYALDKVLNVSLEKDVPENQRVMRLLDEVIRRNAELVAHWQAIGFVHSVLNTDNVSILGITIDYGPYGFMDEFDPSWIPNHSDELGRYTLANQPAIMMWNLFRFAEALMPLLSNEKKQENGGTDANEEKDEKILMGVLGKYEKYYLDKFNDLMRQKLGLPDLQATDAAEIFVPLLQILSSAKVDWTNFWRSLSSPAVQELAQNQNDEVTPTFDEFRDLKTAAKEPTFAAFWTKYSKRLQSSSWQARSEAMRRVNPKFILRNYLAERAIKQAEAGDYSEVHRLQTILEHPFDDGTPDTENYCKPPPESMRSFQCSCSS